MKFTICLRIFLGTLLYGRRNDVGDVCRVLFTPEDPFMLQPQPLVADCPTLLRWLGLGLLLVTVQPFKNIVDRGLFIYIQLGILSLCNKFS